jgi:signal transduction histidine kinase
MFRTDVTRNGERVMKLSAALPGRARTADRLRGVAWGVPVGLQLSLIYTLLFAVTLALLGVMLYSQLEGFLVQNTAQRLDRITHPILVRSFPPPPMPGTSSASDGQSDPANAFQGGSAQQAASYLVHELSRSDVSVAVIDANGATITTTQQIWVNQPDKVPAIPDDWAAQIAAGTITAPVQWIATGSTGERDLVVLTPLTLSTVADPFSSVQASTSTLYLMQATSLGAADAVLNQLKLYITLGIIVGTAVGVMAGLALTRIILRPLERMVRTAEAIAAGDLGLRVRMPAGRNEVARLGSAFDHMVERLGAALEAQRRFVADASHELRTPLTSLEGLSEMLLMGADRGDTGVIQRTVRAMHNELGRLGRLVTDLLTLSRLDTSAPSKFVATDLRRLLIEFKEQMGPTAESRGVTLITHCDEPLTVNGEPDKLKQVLINLTDNALRYTSDGGQVTVSAASDTARGQVKISVQDTGSGIAPEDLPHIFDRFYRGDLSRTRATGNSGLGLAIVYGIVDAHRGTIDVRSKPGEGTCFTITLPMQAPGPIVPRAAQSQEKREIEQESVAMSAGSHR